MFARRSERYLDNPNQLKLDLGGDDQAADAADGLDAGIEETGIEEAAVEETGIAVKGHVRRQRKRRDEALAEHLERYEVEAEVPADVQN